MRKALLAAGLISSFPSALAETETALPLGPGSTLFWQSIFDGDSDKFSEKVIAEGEDFKIYQSNTDFSDGGPADFFALFSGIDFRSCDDEMPTPEERIAVAALWPLEAGKTANIFVTSDNLATIEIQETTDFFLMGQTFPAHAVKIDYQNNEEVEDEALVILDGTELTVRINWSETSRDTLSLVTKPRPGAVYDVSEEAIGTCAALLTETKK